MATKKPISNLSRFVFQISKLHRDLENRYKNDAARFDRDGKEIILYRGHSDHTYELKANIYRKRSDENYSDSESLIYKDVLHNFPDSFQENTNIVEDLVKMQHYGIPTRLIDLTYNPLVALFFASGGYSEHPKTEKNVHGEVLVFSFKRKSIFFSDDVNKFLLIGLTKKIDYDSYFKTALHPFYDFLSKIRVLIDNINRKSELNQSLEELYEAIKNNLSREKGDFFEISNIIGSIEIRIHHFFDYWIRFQKPPKIQSDESQLLIEFENVLYSNLSQYIEHFARELNLNIDTSTYDDMTSFLRRFSQGLLIKPKMNNDRIKRQQGAFLIHPPVCFRKNLREHELLRNDDITIESFLINRRSKSRILSELAENGITYSFLFPELDEYSREIKKFSLS